MRSAHNFKNMSVAHVVLGLLQRIMYVSRLADCSERWLCQHTLSRPSAVRLPWVSFFALPVFSPWWVVTATSLKLPFASEVERIRLQLRCFRAIARIDFVRVYRLLNDLLW
jgi:hypothetical protein